MLKREAESSYPYLSFEITVDERNNDFWSDLFNRTCLNRITPGIISSGSFTEPHGEAHGQKDQMGC